MAERERELTPEEALNLAQNDVQQAASHLWALENETEAWDDAAESEHAAVKAQLDEAQARLAAAEAAVHPEQVTVPEAAEQLGTSMDELAEAQEIVEAEDAVQAEPEPVGSFRDEHFQVVAVGGGSAHEAAERLRREIAEADVTTVEQVEDLEFAEADERAERARLAELESARAARAAQLAAFYGPQPEMPGMEHGHGFEREM